MGKLNGIDSLEERQSSIRSGCLVRVREAYPGLRPSEMRVADEIIKSPQEVIHLSVGEMAARSSVSEATIVRFCQAIGYSGFQSLKMSLAQDLVVPTQFIPKQISRNDDLTSIINKIMYTNTQAISNTVEILDNDEIEKAVIAISNARRVEFYGVGISGLIAQDAAIRLSRIGIPAIAHVDPHLQAHSAAMLGPDDVAVGLSQLGKTGDIIYSLTQAKEAGATTIGITKYGRTSISDLVDIKLLTVAEDEQFRTGASRIAQLQVIDIMFAAIAVRNYDRSLLCIEKTKHIGVDKRI